MTVPLHNTVFWCSLCEKEFKAKTIYDQDLHIRNIHANKIIADAVKQYTRIIMGEMK